MRGEFIRFTGNRWSAQYHTPYLDMKKTLTFIPQGHPTTINSNGEEKARENDTRIYTGMSTLTYISTNNSLPFKIRKDILIAREKTPASTEERSLAIERLKRTDALALELNALNFFDNLDGEGDVLLMHNPVTYWQAAAISSAFSGFSGSFSFDFAQRDRNALAKTSMTADIVKLISILNDKYQIPLDLPQKEIIIKKAHSLFGSAEKDFPSTSYYELARSGENNYVILEIKPEQIGTDAFRTYQWSAKEINIFNIATFQAENSLQFRLAYRNSEETKKTTSPNEF